MHPAVALLLFVITAVAEIVGCFLPLLWLRSGWPIWILLPAAASLGVFAWLLTLHPHAAGRTYAAYGGVYVAVALMWLWLVEHQRPTIGDVTGVVLMLLGAAIIVCTRPQPS